MKKLSLFLASFLLMFFCSNMYAQYVPTIEDLLINDVIMDFEEDTGNLTSRNDDYEFYNDLRTWIPYCNSEPLKILP